MLSEPKHEHDFKVVIWMEGEPNEEGFICGVFQHLGRLLATYYFYDESAEIAKLVQHGETVEKAARAVLGVSHEELGIQVAQNWHLPDNIVNSMQRVAVSHAGKPNNAHACHSNRMTIDESAMRNGVGVYCATALAFLAGGLG